jgi:outer membrane receptor for ferrienterochelin and colicins
MRIRRSTICLILSGTCALFWHSAIAQQHTDTTVMQKLHEVVVTGQYSANSPEKAVQKIKVIDRVKIDAMSAQNLRDVLTNEMNVRLSQDNILGSSMSMQGVSGQNVKILIDGVPVIGRQDGNIDLAQINLGNIERIEIIEGPMSVNYGTNALAGTINLITRKNQKNLIEGKLTSYYESIGTYNLYIRGGIHHKKHTFSLSGGRNDFDGWSNGDKVSLDFSPRIADSSRFMQWKPRGQYMAGMQYEYKMGKTTLNYKADYFREKITNRGMPMQPYGESAFDDYYRTTRIDNAFFLNTSLSRNRNINFLVAYNIYTRTKNTYYNDLTTLNSTLSTGDGDQDTSTFHSINSRGTYSAGPAGSKISYETGYDINVENGSGMRIKNKIQQIADYAAYASAEYKPIEALTIRPGLRYAYNTAFSAPLVPSLNLRYKLTGNITLRGAYAKGFRAPSLKEMYFYFVDINHNIKGNEALKAEYSDNYSLSAVYMKSKGRYSCRLEASAFYNDIRDMITLAFLSGTEYSYVNIGTYKTKGLQLNGELGVSDLKMAAGRQLCGHL